MTNYFFKKKKCIKHLNGSLVCSYEHGEHWIVCAPIPKDLVDSSDILYSCIKFTVL